MNNKNNQSLDEVAEQPSTYNVDEPLVREGYKQTEVGVIPVDWEVASVGSIADISVGKDVDEPHFSKKLDETYCYPVFSNTVDNPGIYGYYNYAEYCGDGLTVVGRGIGLGTAICRTDGFGAIGRLIILFPQSKANNKFIASYINNRIEIFNESGGIPQLTGVSLSNYNIALPALKEQKAIAKALSDVDALIEAQENLIAKKQAIKTATMQQLLRGKKRLSGFGEGKGTKQTELGEIPEDWEVKPLGELLKIRHGKNQSDVISIDGKYPILGTGGEMGRAREFLYSKPSVLIGRKGTIDVPRYMDTPFWTVDTLFYSEVFDSADAKFLFYKFGFIDWYLYNEASGVPSLNAATIEKIIQIVPSRVEEQVAIAEFITDFDKELEILEFKLEKTKSIKQGMMQELLTGKTRLMES